jgi:hypothetical protein
MFDAAQLPLKGWSTTASGRLHKFSTSTRPHRCGISLAMIRMHHAQRLEHCRKWVLLYNDAFFWNQTVDFIDD